MVVVQQNPFTPTNEVLCPKTPVKANQSSQDIEMQEMEPSNTGFMPKTPKAKSNTREISSANSTPGKGFNSFLHIVHYMNSLVTYKSFCVFKLIIENKFPL